VGLTSVGCLVLALTLQAKPARAAPSPQATTATQASYSNPGGSGVCAQTASIETQSAFNKSGLIFARTTSQNSVLQVSSKRKGRFSKRSQPTSSAGFVKRTKKSPIVSRQLSVVPSRSFASSFNEHSLMQRAPLFSLAVPYKKVSKQRIRPKCRLRLQSLRKKKAQRFKGARAGIDDSYVEYMTYQKDAYELSLMRAEAEEKKEKMTSQYQAQTHSDDIQMRAINQRSHKIATIFKKNLKQAPHEQVTFLIDSWGMLFNYPNTKNLELCDSIKAILMDEMIASELLSTLVLSTSNDKKNAGSFKQWKADSEKKWLPLFPSDDNFLEDQKKIAMCLSYTRQKLFEMHVRRHVADQTALRLDFLKCPNRTTIAVYQFGRSHFQKIYKSMNDSFIMVLKRPFDNKLHDTIYINRSICFGIFPTGVLVGRVKKQRIIQAASDLAKEAAFASLKTLKETNLIKSFEAENNGQPTYIETLKAFGIIPPAPTYDRIKDNFYDFESLDS